MLKDIQSLTWTQTIIFIFALLGTLSPGFLTLYLFKPELISSLDTLKVILFSLSLSLPVFIITLFFLDQIAPEKDEPFINALPSLLIASLVSYSSILLSYWLAFSFKTFLITLFIIQALAILCVYVLEKTPSKKSPTQ